MAQIYEEKTVTETRRHFVKTVCDICGRESIKHHWGADPDFRTNEIDVIVRWNKANNWPEGGWGKEVKFDICPNCFKEKLIPFLISQGAIPKETEWDW